MYSRAGESGNYYDNIRRYALGMHLAFAVHLVSDKTGQEFGSGQSLETSWWIALPKAQGTATWPQCEEEKWVERQTLRFLKGSGWRGL